MSEKQRLTQNMNSLFVLQGANYIIPLIALPYLVRVLGPSKFGLIVFAQAFAQYFVILTDYGFNLTATRQISIHRDEHLEVSEIFSAVMCIKLGLMLVSFLVVAAVVLISPGFRADWPVYFAAFLTVVGSVLFPIWFFQGLEKMKYITIVNVSTKFIATLSIFLLVHRPADYFVATLVQSLGFLAAGTSGLFAARLVYPVRFHIPPIAAVRSALTEGWHVFVTSVAMNVLSNSGVFILGLFQSKEVVGAYAAAEKLVKAIAGVFAPATQAVFPLTSARFATSHSAGRSVVLRTGKYLIPVALLVSVLTALLARPGIRLVYGPDYAKYSIVIVYLSIWMFFGVVNNMLGIQYLVGSGRSKAYSVSFLVASAVALVLFFALVPRISFYGILYGMVVGAILLTIIMLWSVMKAEQSQAALARTSPTQYSEVSSK